MATSHQLRDAGLLPPGETAPELPWHPVQGPSDASTMWYAVMRKRTHGIFIGTLVLRHGGQHASLLAQPDWEEVVPGAIGRGLS